MRQNKNVFSLYCKGWFILFVFAVLPKSLLGQVCGPTVCESIVYYYNMATVDAVNYNPDTPPSLPCDGTLTIYFNNLPGFWNPSNTITWEHGGLEVQGGNERDLNLGANDNSGQYTVTFSANSGIPFCNCTFDIIAASTLNVIISDFENTSCFGLSDGEIELTITGGTAPYNYTWSTNGGSYSDSLTNNTISGLAQGIYDIDIIDGSGCSGTITGTQTISSPPSLIVSINSVDVTCNGTSTGEATAMGSGGTLGTGNTYSYEWSASTGGQTTAIAENLPVGTHVVTITDDNDCTAIASVIIEQPLQTSANTGQIFPETCIENNGAFTFSNSGPSPYIWELTDMMGVVTTGDDNMTVTGLSADNDPYTIVITDDDGCEATINGIIIPSNTTLPTIDNPIIASNGGNVPCDSSTVTLTATVTATSGNISDYDWTGPGIVSTNDNIAVVNVAGTYTLIVTQDGNSCIATEDKVITGAIPPTLNADTPDDLTCVVNEVPISASVTSGGTGPFIYSWTDSNGDEISTNPSTDVMLPDTYTVMVTDANGCTDEEEVTVNLSNTDPVPVITSNITEVNCNNLTLTLSAATSTQTGNPQYLWMASNGGTITGGTSMETVQVTSEGTYTLTVTNTLNGCSDQTSETITEDFDQPSVNEDEEVFACATVGIFDLTEANITTEDPSSIDIEYYNDVTGATISNPAAHMSGEGTDLVMVVVTFEDNGCSDTTYIDLTFEQVMIPDIVTFEPDITDTNLMLCNNVDYQVVTATISPNAPTNQDYMWVINGENTAAEPGECVALELSDGISSLMLQATVGSGFNICLINENYSGFTWDSNIDSSAKALRIPATTTLFCNRNDFSSYQWGLQDKTTLCNSIAEGQVYQNFPTGGLNTDDYFYWVDVSDGACTSRLYYLEDPIMRLITPPTNHEEFIMEVSPNPNNGNFQLFIAGNEDKELELNIYDALGRRVFNKAINKEGVEIEENLSLPNLKMGLYFVHLRGSDGINLTEKIIIR